MKSKLLLFLLTFTCFTFGIDKSLKFNSNKVLSHITNFQIINDEGKDKVYGFHYYQPTSIETKGNIKICKINTNLWIVTSDDHTKYHKGYIIYNGKVIDQKTFFPCSWDKEQLKIALSTIDHKHVIDINDNEFEYELEHQTLKIIISYYQHIQKSFIRTIFPIINNFTKIDIKDLEDIAKEQEKQIINIPQLISNVQDIKLSDIEEAVSKSKIDKIYELLECANMAEIKTIAQEILIQSISYYKPEYFVFALDLGAQVTEEHLIKLVSKTIDDFARAKMLTCLLDFNKSLIIDNNILKLSLKAKSSPILDVLIKHFVYWNKLNIIPEEVRKDPIAKHIIAKYEAEAKDYSDPLLHAVFYNNGQQVKEFSGNATETKLNQALEIAQAEMEQIIQKELERRKNLKKIEEQKKKDQFAQIFKAALDNTDTYIEFTKEELEIIRPFKNQVLNKRGETPVLICAAHDIYNNPEDYEKKRSGGKVNLVKQLLSLGADIKCTNNDNKDILALAFEHNNFKIMDYLLNEHQYQSIQFLCNWWSNNQPLCLEFIKYQYPREIFIPWFSEIIKLKTYDLKAFKKTIKALMDEIYIDINKLLKIASKADRCDIAQELINLEANNIEEALTYAPTNSQTFELLNNIIKTKEEKVQKVQKGEQLKIAKQQKKEADKHAKKMGWTDLIKLIEQKNEDVDQIENEINKTNNADLLIADNEGLDAQEHAKNKGLHSIVKCIQKRKDIITCNAQIETGNWTPLNAAVFLNNENEFKKLLKKEKTISVLGFELPIESNNKKAIEIYWTLLNPHTKDTIKKSYLNILANNYNEGTDYFPQDKNLALKIYIHCYKLPGDMPDILKIPKLMSEGLKVEEDINKISQDVSDKLITITDKILAQYYFAIIYYKQANYDKAKELIDAIMDYENDKKNNSVLDAKQKDYLLFMFLNTSIIKNLCFDLQDFKSIFESIIEPQRLDKEELSFIAFRFFDLYKNSTDKIGVAQIILKNKNKYNSKANLRALYETIQFYWSTLFENTENADPKVYEMVYKYCTEFLANKRALKEYYITDLLCKLGIACSKLKKYDEAFNHFTKCVELSNDKTDLATLYEAKTALVIMNLNKMLDINKSIQDAIACLKVLKSSEKEFKDYILSIYMAMENLIASHNSTPENLKDILQNKELFPEQIIELILKKQKGELVTREDLLIKALDDFWFERYQQAHDKLLYLCNFSDTEGYASIFLGIMFLYGVNKDLEKASQYFLHASNDNNITDTAVLFDNIRIYEQFKDDKSSYKNLINIFNYFTTILKDNTLKGIAYLYIAKIYHANGDFHKVYEFSQKAEREFCSFFSMNPNSLIDIAVTHMFKKLGSDFYLRELGNLFIQLHESKIYQFTEDNYFRYVKYIYNKKIYDEKSISAAALLAKYHFRSERHKEAFEYCNFIIKSKDKKNIVLIGNILGNIYRYNYDIVEIDYEKSAYFYKLAYNQNFSIPVKIDAAVNLAQMAYNGLGMPKNKQMARNYLENAINTQNIDDQNAEKNKQLATKLLIEYS